MGMQWKEENGGRVLEVLATGTLAHEDYIGLMPAFERLVKENGLVNVLFDMVDFHGWTPGALWDDVKLDFRHFGDVKRLAVVGDKTWERRMAMFCRPFTRAQIRYFDQSKIDEARQWVGAN